MTSCNNFRVWTQLDDITKHLMESIAINTEKLDPIMATMIHSKTSEFKKLYTDDNVSIYWHPVRMTFILMFVSPSHIQGGLTLQNLDYNEVVVNFIITAEENKFYYTNRTDGDSTDPDPRAVGHSQWNHFELWFDSVYDMTFPRYAVKAYSNQDEFVVEYIKRMRPTVIYC